MQRRYSPDPVPGASPTGRRPPAAEMNRSRLYRAQIGAWRLFMSISPTGAALDIEASVRLIGGNFDVQAQFSSRHIL